MSPVLIALSLIASAAETYVLVSAEKINAASPYVIAPLTEVDGVIIEASAPADAIGAYERAGVSVIRA